MIIVYISIAAILASLGYLGYFAFKTFKKAKPSLNRLSHTVASVQRQTDKIKKQTNELTLHKEQLIADIQYKKAAVNSTILEAKRTAAQFKGLWKIKAFTIMEGKNRLRNIKIRNRRKPLQTY